MAQKVVSRTLVTFSSSPNKVVLLATALGSVVLIGWVDLASGPDISLSLFYLVPIVACGWWCGRSQAAVASLIASACWLAADLFWHDEKFLVISLWNGATRVGIFVTMGLVTARLRADRVHLEALTEEHRQLAIREATLARTDPLTGLANSRAFRECLETELQRSRRDGLPLCLAYLDLDDFKKVNDLHGHAAGDDLLCKVARVLQNSLRRTDLAARLGGDELAVLLWHVHPDDARATAERIAAEIALLAAEYPGTKVGASIGVIHLGPPVHAEVDEAIHLADLAMLEAKGRGKGQVVLRGPKDDTPSHPYLQ